MAPDRWRRTIKSSGFSQSVVVNGDKVLEQNTGDYYPFWLRDLVTSIVDVVPDDFSPRDLKIESPESDQKRHSRENFLAGVTTTSLTVYTGLCSRWDDQAGTPPVQNPVFSTVCFQGEDRVFRAVFSPYFHAEFSDYKEYKGKKTARLIGITPQPGIHLQARIVELSELRHPDESVFAVTAATTEQDRLRSIRIREQDALGRLLNPPQIPWEPVHDGKVAGNVSMMVYIDKEGKVQEIWPLNSDNPLVQEQARKAVMQWRFKPLERDGRPVQIETLLTFHFETTTEPSVSALSDDEGRKLAVSKAEPHFLQTKFAKGTEFTVRIVVDERGRLVSVDNYYKIDPGLFGAAESALHLWLFKPRIVNHKAERFTADITF